jgi:hypothetical protein
VAPSGPIVLRQVSKRKINPPTEKHIGEINQENNTTAESKGKTPKIQANETKTKTQEKNPSPAASQTGKTSSTPPTKNKPKKIQARLSRRRRKKWRN